MMPRLTLSLVSFVVACGSTTSPPPTTWNADHDGPRIAAGQAHTCAITVRGEVLCWGANELGQLGDGSHRAHSYPSAVVSLDSAVELASGRAHTCALRRDGTVWCWGAGLRGQLGDGGEGEEHQARTRPGEVTGISDATRLSAGDYHTCALRRGGRVACWGDDAAGQVGDGLPVGGRSPLPVDLELSGVTAIASGAQHTCAIDADGGVLCWGYGSDGQLGNGVAESSSFPAAVRAGAAFVELSAGRAHTCARTETGRVFCWGADELGQLGDGPEGETSLVPVELTDLGAAISISGGANHTCARRESNAIWCWGANGSGQLGDGTRIDAAFPVPGPALGLEVTAGDAHTCARHAFGMVTCWGDNNHGQLGDGRMAWRAVPSLTRQVHRTRRLAAGGNHTCAIGLYHAYCWGSNADGQLGELASATTSTPVPAIFAHERREVSLTLALGRTCARDAEGIVACAGHGVDAPEGRVTVELSALGAVQQIAVTRDFACALNAEGAIGCWGDNSRGQLGDGTLERREAAVLVRGAGDAREVAVGSAHACARLLSGAVFCWGANEHGQLGDGTQESRTVPTQVDGLDDADALALGRSHSCALRRDGSVVCWGSNTVGQLGDGTRTSRPSHGPVRDLAGVVQLEAGWVHTCARTDAGAVLCWGENRYGQLGRQSEESSTATPREVGSLGRAEEIASGGLHTCARVAGGRVACWGANHHGQLGDGVTLLATRPVLAIPPSHVMPESDGQ